MYHVFFHVMMSSQMENCPFHQWYVRIVMFHGILGKLVLILSNVQSLLLCVQPNSAIVGQPVVYLLQSSMVDVVWSTS